MKKLVFSAIALVAFTTVSFANNTVEQKNEAKNNQVIEQDDTLGCDHCYDYADSLDDGSDRTNQTWMRNVDSCRTSNGCEAEFTKLIKKIE